MGDDLTAPKERERPARFNLGAFLAPLSRPLTWGVVDQVLSSVTNLGLSLLAGRLLGPSGLGVVFVGFSVYLVVLGVVRAAVFEPLVAVSSGLDEHTKANDTRDGFGACSMFALGGALTLFAVGLFTPQVVGRGFLLIAPWIVPAVVQDFWRATLFRDGRGAAAALNDAIWVLAMAVGLPLALAVRSETAVVLLWGLGATAGAVLGFFQTRIMPSAPRLSLGRWRTRLWPLGRWLMAESAVYVLFGQTVWIGLAAIVGSAEVGGIRSAQVVFAPLTVLGPAVVLPGLPLLARAMTESVSEARRLATAMSAVLLAITVAYLAIVGLFGGTILGLAFGHEFARFDALVLPLGAAQILAAAGAGPSLWLKASQRGRSVLINRTISSVSVFGLGILLGLWGGTVPALWGIALGTGLGTASAIWLASLPGNSTTRSAAEAP